MRAVCNPGGSPPVQVRDFLAQNYPDGVNAVGPGSFNVNTSVSKTFGFGKRKGQVAQGRQSSSGARGQRGRDSSGAGGQRSAGGGESARFSITFTTGITNLFNRVNYGQFSGVIGSAYFGVPSSSGPARQMGFNVRFNF